LALLCGCLFGIAAWFVSCAGLSLAMLFVAEDQLSGAFGICSICGMPIGGALGAALLYDHHKRRREQRERRSAAGRCIACGYPLRPSGSTVCPECGEPGPDV